MKHMESLTVFSSDETEAWGRQGACSAKAERLRSVRGSPTPPSWGLGLQNSLPIIL